MMRCFAVALAAATLGGCSLLPEQEPAELYRLSPPAAPAMQTSTQLRAEKTLLVELPNAVRATGGDNMLIVKPDGSLANAAGAKWSSTARNMVQDYLVQAYEATPGVPTPVRPGDGVASDYDLSLDLRRFEAEYDRGLESAPVVHVAIGARIITQPRILVATRAFVLEQRADANRMGAIVEAFEAAMEEVSADIIAWSVEAVEAYEREVAMAEAAEAAGAEAEDLMD